MFRKAYIEVTNLCNRSCSFCIGTNRPGRHMTREEFSLVLDRVQGHTKYLYYHLMGEPLTHPLLPEFLSMAKERGFHSILTTNGTLLSRLGEVLLEAGLHKVNLSIHSFEDGTEATHREYLLSCCRFAAAAACRGVIVVFRLWNQGDDDGRNLTAEAILHEFFPDPWVIERRGTRISDHIYLEYGERFQWPDLSADDMGTSVYCYGLKDQIGILSDGTVVPCCLDHNGDLSLGNLFHQSLEEILSTPRAALIRTGFQNRKASEELCRKCGYARRF